jgi:2-polyprenyl-6-methoxyphenol hydroxylase-like FAD-dependent oxidoreductase
MRYLALPIVTWFCIGRMNNSPDIVIVGGGPVGLLLGCLLAGKGISFIILERRQQRSRHSRSIGIHPPSLEILESVDVAEEMISRGITIPGGIAFGNRMRLGRLSFETCPGPYRFVLSLPQTETEAILENRLGPGSLIRGATVTGIDADSEFVITTYTDEISGRTSSVESKVLIGCDGAYSTVREKAGFDWDGGPYPDTYLMGDFEDSTDFGSDATVFLTDAGLVESFPLPGLLRRWVVKTDLLRPAATPGDLSELVFQRTGLAPDPESNSMISAFGVQHYMANPFCRDRIFLAGDAAHVISPIGGQGMNLGWMDALMLVDDLESTLCGDAALGQVADQYNRSRRRAAEKAMRRALFNMNAGRRHRHPRLKYAIVRAVLNTPSRHIFSRLFSMRGL